MDTLDGASVSLSLNDRVFGGLIGRRAYPRDFGPRLAGIGNK